MPLVFLCICCPRRRSIFLLAEQYSPPENHFPSNDAAEDTEEDSLGWKRAPLPTKVVKTNSNEPNTWDAKKMYKDQKKAIKVIEETQPKPGGFLQRLQELLQELQARLQRDTHIRYALRELEMQRALMGKGASRKIRGPELIRPDGEEDDELNEDEQDALFGKRRKIPSKRWFLSFSHHSVELTSWDTYGGYRNNKNQQKPKNRIRTTQQEYRIWQYINRGCTNFEPRGSDRIFADSLDSREPGGERRGSQV